MRIFFHISFQSCGNIKSRTEDKDINCAVRCAHTATCKQPAGMHANVQKVGQAFFFKAIIILIFLSCFSPHQCCFDGCVTWIPLRGESLVVTIYCGSPPIATSAEVSPGCLTSVIGSDSLTLPISFCCFFFVNTRNKDTHTEHRLQTTHTHRHTHIHTYRAQLKDTTQHTCMQTHLCTLIYTLP